MRLLPSHPDAGLPSILAPQSRNPASVPSPAGSARKAMCPANNLFGFSYWKEH